MPKVKKSKKSCGLSEMMNRILDIRTRNGSTGDAANSQRKFLRIASLELNKTLCSKVGDAARKRSQEMDRKIAEIESEKEQLLA